MSKTSADIIDACISSVKSSTKQDSLSTTKSFAAQNSRIVEIIDLITFSRSSQMKMKIDSIDDDVIMIEMKTLIKNESRENQKSVILIVNDDNDDNQSKAFDRLQTLSTSTRIDLENLFKFIVNIVYRFWQIWVIDKVTKENTLNVSIINYDANLTQMNVAETNVWRV